ncbi:beta-carotene isomerase D27, chloroplastic isoform X2 [Rosa chinensis]|uniref:beta-carotene isomerase D27, chloroplastic isoform X2 n=1 Tax=Rosa chinensis TaxID=74649 RepID=UPI000D089F37|nr:beta-carotene isomerase D27, chloroplastic isoform X2 [Rosa chinensis]
MKALAVVCPPRISFSSCSNSSWQQRHLRLQSKPKSQLRICSRFRVSSCLIKEGERQKHKGGVVDELLLNVFRNKMVKQVGWDSHKPGYDGLIEVANRMMLNNPTNSDTKEAAVRVLISLFPPFLLELYKLLIAPIQGGKIAAFMVARVTAISCQWLMGPCTVNSVDLPDGNSWTSGVFVEKCKYLEESKCVGICVNTFFFQGLHGCPFTDGTELQRL